MTPSHAQSQLKARKQLSLHTRISLLMTAVVSSMMLILGGMWLTGTRDSINEEITAGTLVCEQWLNVLVGEARATKSAAAYERLLLDIKTVGRIRANALEVVDATGQRIYLSPNSTYKAGRASPAWFAHITEPVFASRRIQAGNLTLIITPDPSRASLDVWDSLFAMTAWGCVFLAVLFLAMRSALNRAFYPLDQIESALERTGRGRFDIRLPVYATRELNRLAIAFNGMLDRLNDAVNDNVRLGSERELSRLLHIRLESERHSIAMELHDELAQGITAVRALAGAILQRTRGQSNLQDPAQSIISVTDQIQQGIRNILQRLRPLGSDSASLNHALQRYIACWRQYYPDIALHIDLNSETLQVSDELAFSVLRIVQEGLTNVVRHATATQVKLTLNHMHEAHGHWLELTLTDNGCGLAKEAGSNGGFGLTGMRERVAELNGELSIANITAGGVCLRVRLPARNEQTKQISEQTQFSDTI